MDEIHPYTGSQNTAHVLPHFQAVFCRSLSVTSVHETLEKLRKLDMISRITLFNTLSISQFLMFTLSVLVRFKMILLHTTVVY